MQDSESPKQLRSWVEERLREAIINGEFKPGEWLRQQRLAEELGVSQMPVREALKKLAAEGLVEHVPYRGVRVVEFSPDDVADLYAHRSFLEGLAARAAAQKITPEAIEHLKRIQLDMDAHLAPEDLEVYRELNRRFHEAIYAASGRDYLIRTLEQLWTTFPTMLWSNFAYTAAYSLPERDTDDTDEHCAIIRALESGDADEAERLARHHVQAAGNHLVAYLREKVWRPS
ncbi:MAG: GntR family transcriptional regulator [Anaerolineae bacterium]|nr:GntR family transcriptional regulator [Anaerolineae bacterium]